MFTSTCFSSCCFTSLHKHLSLLTAFLPPLNFCHLIHGRIVGYDEQKCDQPWTLSLALKLIVSVPSIFFVLLSLLFFHYYPITEQSRERTKKILQERRRSSVYQSSGGSGSRYMERLPSVSIPSQSSMVSEDVQESML